MEEIIIYIFAVAFNSNLKPMVSFYLATLWIIF